MRPTNNMLNRSKIYALVPPWRPAQQRLPPKDRHVDRRGLDPRRRMWTRVSFSSLRQASRIPIAPPLRQSAAALPRQRRHEAGTRRLQRSTRVTRPTSPFRRILSRCSRLAQHVPPHRLLPILRRRFLPGPHRHQRLPQYPTIRRHRDPGRASSTDPWSLVV